MPKNDALSTGTITQTAVRFDTSEYAVVKRAAARRGMSINAFVCSASFFAANKVLEAASSEEELRQIVLRD